MKYGTLVVELAKETSIHARSRLAGIKRREAERQRAERVLRLELLRQAGDREIGYLRLMAGVREAIRAGRFADYCARFRALSDSPA